MIQLIDIKPYEMRLIVYYVKLECQHEMEVKKKKNLGYLEYRTSNIKL